MVEQWPFKPLVTGSSPVALIILEGGILVILTQNGVPIAILIAAMTAELFKLTVKSIGSGF